MQVSTAECEFGDLRTVRQESVWAALCERQRSKSSILIDVVFSGISEEQLEPLIGFVAGLLAEERIHELEAMKGHDTL